MGFESIVVGGGGLGARLAGRAIIFQLALNLANVITAGLSTASGLEGTGRGGRRTAEDVQLNTERNLKDFGNFLKREVPKMAVEVAPSIFPLQRPPRFAGFDPVTRTVRGAAQNFTARLVGGSFR